MGIAALADDYLFLGPLLQARLQDQVADVPVDLCETADQVLAADKREHVLMVMWAGDHFGDDAGRGSSQAMRQRWLVILGITNVSKVAAARNLAAGPLLSRTHRAVAGWEPPGVQRTFRRATAALRPTFTTSKAVYPLGFEINLNL